MQNQPAEIEWKDGGVPVSTRFDDPYYSLENGLSETRHVFLDGNDLPARYRDGFHIAELGFGTGLSFLATLESWRFSNTPGGLNYTSFEAYPMNASDMAQALDAFGGLTDLAALLMAQWTGDGGSFRFAGGVTLNLIVGDARKTLPQWRGQVDAWYLDGFSPAKNPELWGASLLQDVARHTVKDGTVATYTAAGFVRRGLQQAGFSVTRAPGFGRKRHMTKATLR